MRPKPTTCVSLRFAGDELDPAEIDQLFQIYASAHVSSCRKGERVAPAQWKPIAETGYWVFSAICTDDDVNLQLDELLKHFPDDLELWRELSGRFEIEAHVHYDIGFFGELRFTARTMKRLTERNISLMVILDAGRPP